MGGFIINQKTVYSKKSFSIIFSLFNFTDGGWVYYINSLRNNNKINNEYKMQGITTIIATHDIALIGDGIRVIELLDGIIMKDGLTKT